MNSSKRDKLLEMCYETLRRMYKETEPKLEDPIKFFKGMKGQPFMKFYLPEERFESILDEVVKENKLNSFDESVVRNNVCLNLPSPNGCKERWLKEWEIMEMK